MKSRTIRATLCLLKWLAVSQFFINSLSSNWKDTKLLLCRADTDEPQNCPQVDLLEIGAAFLLDIRTRPI